MNFSRAYPAILLLSLLPAAQAQKPCKDQAVIYEKPPDWIEKQIQISKTESAPPTGKKVASPQSTRWFVEQDPDYTKPGPWNTTLFVGNNTAGKAILTLTVIKHGNTFSAFWINDELVFVQASWGHIASSDIILDTSTGTLLYDELANYGELVEPCQ
jgi:hypothetical protein